MGGLRKGTEKNWQGGSTRGGKLTKTTDEQRTTEHQEVAGRNSGEKSLRSGPNQWKQSDPRLEEIRTRQLDSIQWGYKGNGEGMWNSHCNTQHPVGEGRGTGDGATRLMEGQHWDQGPAGDKTHWRHSHVTEIGLHGMGDGVRESTLRGDRHSLEGRG